MADVPTASFAHAEVDGFACPALALAGVEPNVGHELFRALEAARGLLDSRKADACIVAAADSLANGRALDWLQDRGRLKMELYPDGVIPGEAAAAGVTVQAQQGHRLQGEDREHEELGGEQERRRQRYPGDQQHHEQQFGGHGGEQGAAGESQHHGRSRSRSRSRRNTAAWAGDISTVTVSIQRSASAALRGTTTPSGSI